VRKNILAPGATRKWRPEFQLITLMLIEAGCRPSEIINLRIEDFHIDEPVPYISIRARNDREVKTDTSGRDIPLVGISLEAARRREHSPTTMTRASCSRPT
jgi:integrase